MEQSNRNTPRAQPLTSDAGQRIPLPSDGVRPSAGIAAFWKWWDLGGGRRLSKAIDRNRRHEAERALNSLLADIDSRLSWEIAPTIAGLRRLTVTANGHPELRCLARRWLLAAPKADPYWRFADLLGPLDATTLKFRGLDVDIEDTWVRLFPSETTFRAAVSHPLMSVLEPPERTELARVLLDAACGEAAVENWIAQVTATEVVSEDAVDLKGVATALVELSIDNLSADLEPAWRVLQGTHDGKPMVAMARVPLVPLIRPECDQHVQIDVPFSDDSEGGFPGPESLPQLREFEDGLIDLVALHGECVAAETMPGVRRMHFYTDSLTEATQQLVDAAATWPQGDAIAVAEMDPAWRAVAHLRA